MVSRKHFVAVASQIAQIQDHVHRHSVANHFADLFAASSPTFSKERFVAAASGTPLFSRDKPAPAQGGLTAKHFRYSADLLAKHADRDEVKAHIMRIHQSMNPGFKEDLYAKRAGVQHESMNESISPGLKSQIRRIMGNVHVGTPDEEVTADWHKRIDRAIKKGGDISQGMRGLIVHHALRIHQENKDIYNQVMGGSSSRPRKKAKNETSMTSGASMTTGPSIKSSSTPGTQTSEAWEWKPGGMTPPSRIGDSHTPIRPVTKPSSITPTKPTSSFKPAAKTNNKVAKPATKIKVEDTLTPIQEARKQIQDKINQGK